MRKVSIIIPTKNEPYVNELIKGIHKVLSSIKHEIIVVDKSDVVPRIKGAKLLIQKSEGLGNAVIEGLEIAKGDVIVTMDGDGSVSGETPIMISDGKKIEIVEIGKFVDSFFKDGEEGYKPVKGYFVLSHSFRPSTKRWKNYLKLKGTAELKPFSGVYRHSVPYIYEIKYRGGDVKVTGNHSIFVSKSNWSFGKKISIKVKKASEIVAGNKFKGDHVIPLDRAILKVPEIKTLRVYYKSKLKRNKKKYESIPESVKLTNDLYRLFGYYIADGSIAHSKTLCFSFNIKEKNFIEDVLNTMKKVFNLQGKIYVVGNEVNIFYYYLYVAKFFENHFGKGVRGKRIPTFLFSTKRKNVVEFLRGWVNGDGYVSKNKKVVISTVDRNLAIQLVWLLTCHGIVATLFKKVSKERHVGGKKIKKTFYYEVMIPKISNPFLKSKNKPQVTKGLVTKKLIRPHGRYVYDIVGSDGESFYGGISPILLHNSHRPEDLPKLIEKTKDFDIVIGSKYVAGGKTEDKWYRVIISRLYCWLASFVLGLSIKDNMSGFAAVRREVYERIKPNPRGFKINMELLYKAKKFGFKAAEAPITFLNPKKKGRPRSFLYEIFVSPGFKEAFRTLRFIFELKLGVR